MKATHFASVAILLAACGTSARADVPVTKIAEILARPAAYDGQLVRVRGAAVVRFEASFVCSTPEKIDSDNSKACLWLAPGDVGGRAYDIDQLHGKTVEIVGYFRAKHTWHMGAYGGAIAVIWSKVTGAHGKGDIPPPLP